MLSSAPRIMTPLPSIPYAAHTRYRKGLFIIITKIIFNAVLQPPAHLANDIKQIRAAFDDYNKECYQHLLMNIKLRQGITQSMAVKYFLTFQDMFNGYYQGKTNDNNDFASMIDDHELKISELLHVILYGIIEER